MKGGERPGERSSHGGFRGIEEVLARLLCCRQRGRVGLCLRDVCCAAVASRVNPVVALSDEIRGASACVGELGFDLAIVGNRRLGGWNLIWR